MKKTIIFDGKKYFFDKARGYYCDHGKYLHRVVWEKYHGKIPEGMVIHHIDHNRVNNDISNLACLTEKDHRLIHAHELTEEQREFRRKNLNEKARPLAVAWHKSEASKEFHKRNAKILQMKVEKVCKCCGKTFEAIPKTNFCSNACKSMYRRKMMLDNEQRVCVVCGKTFQTNRYHQAKTCSRSCRNRMRAKSFVPQFHS